MRTSVALRKKYDIEDLADFTPAPPLVAPAAEAEAPTQDLSTGHLCDLPPAIHALSIGAWGFLFLVLWATFWSSGNALFMVALASVYAVIFFALPAIMARFHPERPREHPNVREFLAGKFDTLYGPVSGTDAVLQVVLVPVALAMGGLAMGFIIAWARHAA
jgi:hypothetical protein